jgi:hypothetical protein
MKTQATSDSKKKLTKNIEDIKRSIKSWPDRTVEQQAVIYKKRYEIQDSLEEVTRVLEEILNKKISTIER